MLPIAPACSGSFYPGTGAASECGEGPGEGFTVNVPWQCGGMGNGDYVAAFQHVLLPIAMEFNPDLIIASAGEQSCPLWQICGGTWGEGQGPDLPAFPGSWAAVGRRWAPAGRSLLTS